MEVHQVTKNGILAVIAALALPTLSMAQDDMIVTGPHQGAVTGNISGSFTSVSGSDSSTFSVFGSYFFSDVFEGLAGLTYVRVSGSDSTGFALGGNYYFMRNMSDPKMHPYLGVRWVRFDSGGGDADGFAGALGLHYFIRPNISFTPELQIGDLDNESFTTLGFGLTMWFR